MSMRQNTPEGYSALRADSPNGISRPGATHSLEYAIGYCALRAGGIEMTTYKTIAFVDTETTGLKSDSLVWSVGVVLCRLKIPSSGEWIVDERHCEEWILPRMSSEIPKNAYQRGTIIEAFRNDCDEAADIARDLMCGTYDPHEFKDRMSEHLESLRMEREAEICHFLDQADEAWAWHARFDQDVLDGMLEYETPEIRLISLSS